MPDDTSSSTPTLSTDLDLRPPAVRDGAELWRIARDSAVLDLNSSYSYLLWCRDFADTSVVATVDGAPAGFVTGYRRPERPDTLLVWQVAVDAGHRGRGIALRMLDALADRHADGVARLEATVTSDNVPSIRLFESFAAARGAELERTPLFPAEVFPDGHEIEYLYAIGPLRSA